MYWLGRHLREYVVSFASFSIPHAEQIPKYYYNALRVFRMFVHMVPEFMGRQSVTTKFIYGKLIQRKQIKCRDSALVRVEGNSIKILLRLHPP